MRNELSIGFKNMYTFRMELPVQHKQKTLLSDFTDAYAIIRH